MRCALCGRDGATPVTTLAGLESHACPPSESDCGAHVWEASILDACRAGPVWRALAAWEARRCRAAALWLAFLEPPPALLASPAARRPRVPWSSSSPS